MRIVIAGGSMAGLFSAALLRQAGHEVHVFERSRSGLEGRGAGLVAQDEVFALLRTLGLDHVAQSGVIARERIILDQSGAVLSRNPVPQMQISWDRLYLAVRSLLPDGYHVGAAVMAAGQDEAEAWVELDDGRRVDADLVIGADGIGSAIRSVVAPGASGPSYAGYVAWRALIPERDMLDFTAQILSDRFAFYHMSGGQALGYTVPGPAGELAAGARRYNAVWYRRVDDPALALTDAQGQTHAFSLAPGAMSSQAAGELVEAAVQHLPPPFVQVFAVEKSPFVQAIFDMETPRMVDGRVALIGDAAFVARPHTAMGVAKAAGDATALAQAVAQGWTPQSRAEFERQRLHAGRSIVAYGRRLGASLT